MSDPILGATFPTIFFRDYQRTLPSRIKEVKVTAVLQPIRIALFFEHSSHNLKIILFLHNLEIASPRSRYRREMQLCARLTHSNADLSLRISCNCICKIQLSESDVCFHSN